MNALLEAPHPGPSCKDDPVLNEVLTGMRGRHKRLPSKLFYDAEGSALFELICQQPEYDLTRMEVCILKAYSVSIADALGPGVRLVEFGSGSGLKTRLLLASLDSVAAYVPVEISRAALAASVDALRDAFPALRIAPLEADFTQQLSLPYALANRSIVFFPGSTLGNLEPPDAIALLRNIRAEVGNSGGALIGIDLQKKVAEMEAAYNDRAGMTARFTLNMLAHLNRRFGADFDLATFAHEARYDTVAQRIATRIVSRIEQIVTIRGEAFRFNRGEGIQVEYSHKYTLEGFGQMARQANLRIANAWTDPRRRFAVVYLESVAVSRK
jgi:dimethylhistidine N-methyltransferase